MQHDRSMLVKTDFNLMLDDGNADRNSAIQITDQSVEPPRKRGRPKGLPKTGGRKKAVRNWTNPEIRDELLNRSNAIETIASIAAGEKQRWSGPTGKTVTRYPTAQEQLQAISLILSKTVPSLQAMEVTGQNGSDLFSKSTEPQHNVREAARAIMELFEEATVLEDADDRIVEMLKLRQQLS